MATRAAHQAFPGVPSSRQADPLFWGCLLGHPAVRAGGQNKESKLTGTMFGFPQSCSWIRCAHFALTQRVTHHPVMPPSSTRSLFNNNNERNVFFQNLEAFCSVADSHPCLAPHTFLSVSFCFMFVGSYVPLHLETDKQHSSPLGAFCLIQAAVSGTYTHPHSPYPQPLQTEHPATTLKSNKPQ